MSLLGVFSITKQELSIMLCVLFVLCVCVFSFRRFGQAVGDLLRVLRSS